MQCHNVRINDATAEILWSYIEHLVALLTVQLSVTDFVFPGRTQQPTCLFPNLIPFQFHCDEKCCQHH